MPEAIQLSLFDNAQTDTTEKAQIEWSYSRRQTLERCARRYYYDYYGAKARLATTDPQKENIRFLSTLSNRYLRSGDILHIAIRLFYKHGDSSSEWLVDWARRTYRTNYEYSRDGGGLRPPDERYPPVMLLEFYYDQPNVETLYVESEERLVSALESFLTSPAYAAARYGGQRSSAKVERWIFVRTTVFNARGKVDLAFPQGDRLAIVDWKAGETEPPSKSLQLAFYALWAVDTEGYPPEDIALYRGQLMDGTLQLVALNERILLRVRARIIQDLELMRVLDEYGRDAVVDAFPPCGFPKVCRLCPYQCICPGVAT
jgi:hypothetical protein